MPVEIYVLLCCAKFIKFSVASGTRQTGTHYNHCEQAARESNQREMVRVKRTLYNAHNLDVSGVLEYRSSRCVRVCFFFFGSVRSCFELLLVSTDFKCTFCATSQVAKHLKTPRTRLFYVSVSLVCTLYAQQILASELTLTVLYAYAFGSFFHFFFGQLRYCCCLHRLFL